MTLMSNMFVSLAAPSGNPWGTTRTALELAEQCYRAWMLKLKVTVPLETLLSPRTWIGCKELQRDDLVRITMPAPPGERRYECVLVCLHNVGAGGATMGMWHSVNMPAASEGADHTKATNHPRIEHKSVA